MQHDVQEFNRVLQDRLESKMKVCYFNAIDARHFLNVCDRVPLQTVLSISCLSER